MPLLLLPVVALVVPVLQEAEADRSVGRLDGGETLAIRALSRFSSITLA